MRRMIFKGRDKKINKGITLIELVIVLSLLISIMSFSITNYFKLYNSWTNNTNIDFCNNYILHMIKNSALHCKNENKSGYLFFTGKEKVKFFCNNKKVGEYDLPLGFEFINIESFYYRININNLGEVIESTTISYKDMNEDVHSITIRVGTRYAQIQ